MLMMRSAMAFSSIVHSPYISLQIQVQTNALQSPATPLIIIQHKSNPFHLNSKKNIYSARASRKDHPTGQKGGASPWHLAIMLAKKRMNRKAVMKCPIWHIPPPHLKELCTRGPYYFSYITCPSGWWRR